MTGLDPQVPIIGDLDATTRPPSPRAFRIAAPIADRIAILLRQAEQCDGPNLRLAVIDAAPAEHELVAAGTSDVVLEWHDPARPEAAIAAARAAGAQAILVLAPRETLTALLGAGVTLPLLVPGQPDDDAVAGAAMIPASDGAPNVRLAFVGLAPAQIDDTAFRSVMPPRAGGGERSLLMYEAYASAVVFQEAVKTAGRRLDRAALVEALEALRDVRTGVMPAVSFAPNRHDGLSGAAVVGFTGDGHATFLAPWRDAESLSRSAAECRSALK
jgi:ABC-type branched-subunit amino acid transport system substrate-binding protein